MDAYCPSSFRRQSFDFCLEDPRVNGLCSAKLFQSDVIQFFFSRLIIPQLSSKPRSHRIYTTLLCHRLKTMIPKMRQKGQLSVLTNEGQLCFFHGSFAVYVTEEIFRRFWDCFVFCFDGCKKDEFLTLDLVWYINRRPVSLRNQNQLRCVLLSTCEIQI